MGGWVGEENGTRLHLEPRYWPQPRITPQFSFVQVVGDPGHHGSPHRTQLGTRNTATSVGKQHWKPHPQILKFWKKLFLPSISDARRIPGHSFQGLFAMLPPFLSGPEWLNPLDTYRLKLVLSSLKRQPPNFFFFLNFRSPSGKEVKPVFGWNIWSPCVGRTCTDLQHKEHWLYYLLTTKSSRLGSPSWAWNGGVWEHLTELNIGDGYSVMSQSSVRGHQDFTCYRKLPLPYFEWSPSLLFTSLARAQSCYSNRVSQFWMKAKRNLTSRWVVLFWLPTVRTSLPDSLYCLCGPSDLR